MICVRHACGWYVWLTPDLLLCGAEFGLRYPCFEWRARPVPLLAARRARGRWRAGFADGVGPCSTAMAAALAWYGLTGRPVRYSIQLSSGTERVGWRVHTKFDGLGRFADPSLLILTSLADGPKHGYAVMTDVAAFSGVRMEPGTLYGALSRLERRGWVRPLATEERRRPYEITAAGEAVLAEQLTSMQQIVRVGLQRTATA